MDKIFFISWDSFIRTGVTGILAYIGLVAMLRVVGNRTLAQLNAFDFIITVALGSTLATVILNKNVPLADGLLALFLLILLQFIFTRLSVKSKLFEKAIKAEPFVLYYQGRYLDDALRKHRVTRDEILQIARSNGNADLNEIDAIVIETNGKFSVLKKSITTQGSSLENVVGIPNEGNPATTK